MLYNLGLEGGATPTLSALLKKPEHPENLRTEVSEAYSNYEPSVDAAAITRRLLSYVEPKHLAGLKAIVLTNASASAREKGNSHLGYYIKRSKNNPAWIQVFVDRILDRTPPSLLKIPILREIVLAKVVYHEVGHHIQIGILKGNYKKEPVAEEWAKELSTSYFLRRLWFLFPVIYLFAKLRTAYRAMKRLMS